MQKTLTISEIKKKLEHFCAYQERCHEEVIIKLRNFTHNADEADEIVVHLINENFLNEERFAQSFARGKHRIKHWGKTRIVNELKQRNISQYNINSGLKEITDEEYLQTFDCLAEKYFYALGGKNDLKKRKKFCDFLLRKGYENQLVYDKVKHFFSSRE